MSHKDRIRIPWCITTAYLLRYPFTWLVLRHNNILLAALKNAAHGVDGIPRDSRESSRNSVDKKMANFWENVQP